MRDELPLRPGAQGPAVVTLQQRLVQLGLPAGDDPGGTYGEATATAVKAFQRGRGLRIDGICGRDTWASMVEAGFGLGDRLLFQRRPMLRGDDIADLQKRLGALGFDAGRLDGIFGPDTTQALTQFQRNAGIVADGICGPDTLSALLRVSGHVRGSVLASIREEERLKGPGSQGPPRVALGAELTFSPMADALADLLAEAGSVVSNLPGADAAALAAGANAFGSDLYVHLAPAEEPGIGVAYYAFENYASLRGQRLARMLLQSVPTDVLGHRRDLNGMRLIVLRETRMPAVHIELGTADDALYAAPTLLPFVAATIIEWSTTPPA